MRQPSRNFSTWARRLGKAAVDLLFPPGALICVACTRQGSHLCDHCAQAVDFPPAAICSRCGQQQHTTTDLCAFCQQEADVPLHMTRAAALHTFPLREAIHQLKYAGCPELAPLLARYLVAAYQTEPWPTLHAQIDAVVPIPLHQTRLQERGYNQAELLGQAFCETVGLPFYPTWVVRVRETENQVHLGRADRQRNVKGAFLASPEIAGQNILLIDDVSTTGSTLRECATAARAAGAAAVYALALAMPVQRDLSPDKTNNDKMTR